MYKTMSDKNQGLFDIFSNNERKIAELYLIYAAAFSEQRTMWEKMSLEEIGHAEALKRIAERYGEENKYYSIIENGRGILDYVGNYIDEKITEARLEKLGLNKAINTALSLELSMIEKKCFDIFSTTEEEILSVLKRLNRETEDHFRRLKAYVNLAEYESE